MLTSYHVHTNRSDGESPLRDIIDSALKLGLDELGISDHYVLLPGGRTASWSMPIADLPAYVDELLWFKAELEGRLTIRVGIEADFDAGTASQLAEVLRPYPFDYVLGSVHFVDGFPIDKCREEWDAIDQRQRNEIVRGYWDRIIGMARSGLFDIAAHLDLYKKFGFLPTIDVSGQVSEALAAISEADMAVEINTAGYYKDIAEAYPSPAIIKQCAERRIPIIITADAHHPDHLTRGCDRALALAREAGYTQLAAYDGRRRVTAMPPPGRFLR